MANLRFLFRKRLSISPASIDTAIRDYPFTISRESANNYRDVVSVESGKFEDGAIHPLYLTKISWHIVENLNEFLFSPIKPSLLKMLVHMSNHFEYYKPLEYDKKYVVKSHLCLIEPHRKGTKLTLRFDYLLDDDLVAVEHTSGLLFGVKCQGKGRVFGKLPRHERVDEGDLWYENIPIERQLPYVYAKKAEIDAPIHTDPSFAKSIGLPDIILQGTCTFAMSVSLIMKAFNIEEREVKQLSVNFTGMLTTPNTIKVNIVFRSENKIVFSVNDDKGSTLIKGGSIIFASRSL